ncbi:helix-turn-helix domain-containing protein [Shinella sp. HZN7]|uniref:helix-turn-helix domain-containing protein n=1 Tax=Shinella sp. (strain HZN7) TaxID=879274 RepID=UPI0007DA4CA5|nr:helix-turn-helix transcriptional regulator [Shinella sp. HZN7]ANH06257.1 hypothetical protein shn_20910 [Shinella sp. HZN7]MCA0339633.1 helix-turn-helix transcriptional regulator [Pseudomonadota bacterium]
MNFGPKNHDEAVVFATEELRAQVQYDILRQIKAAGLSQAQLAQRMGVSAAWVSQVLSDDANLTLETIAKIYVALGRKCSLATEPNDEVRRIASDHRPNPTELWQVQMEKAFRTEFTERRAGTTELLMQVIAARTTRVHATQICNDNLSDRVFYMSEAV